jgi:hypothetical protein
MKFKVAKRDLEAALQVVSGCLGKDAADITSHFTFRRRGTEDKYTLEVLAYTGRIFSSCPVTAVAFEDPKAKEKAAFTVEGWRLKQWLQFVPDDGTALTFALDEGEVVVRAKRGKQVFQSLDPSTFPHWDKTLEEAKSVARLPAARLAAALAYSKLFASIKEAKEPGMCCCEVRDGGILYSTDKKVAALIRVKGLEESKLRVHVQDAGGFISFLGLLDEGEVELLEHDRMAVLRRSDGAMFGETRFSFPFPKSSVGMDDTDQHQWTLPLAELQQIIGFLVSGASTDDNRLRLSPGEEAGDVVLSMVNTTGKTTELTLSGVTKVAAPKAPEIPEDGFWLDHRILTKILAFRKDEMITFGLSVRGDRGFTRIAHEQFECKFLTLLPWLR